MAGPVLATGSVGSDYTSIIQYTVYTKYDGFTQQHCNVLTGSVEMEMYSVPRQNEILLFDILYYSI